MNRFRRGPEYVTPYNTLELGVALGRAIHTSGELRAWRRAGASIATVVDTVADRVPMLA